jgi:single-stranded-DNA-specific exonuclease
MECVLNVTCSVSKKKWVQRTGKVQNPDRIISAIIQRHRLPEVIARCLVGRDVDLDDIDLFLSPKMKDSMPEPHCLKGMQEAVDTSVQKIIEGGSIGLFADYDVDGASSAALLMRFFKMLKIETILYIPDRVEEGYGPNNVGFRKLKAAGTKLIFTLDCGILAFDVLKKASNDGCEVIVIDHHMAEADLPAAKSIINPNRLDDDSELGELAAVGVCFLFLVGLNRRLREIGWYNKGLKEPNLLKLLDLVALGTVCDVVPLRGLNRAFVSQGLKVIGNRSNLGLRILSDLAKIEKKTDAYQLGFVLGPRINAGGRVGLPDAGARLLSSSDPLESLELAKILDANNSTRKEIEALVLEEAILQVEKNNLEDSVLVVSGQNWHPGVIGIIAARLKEKYNRPACVISLIGDSGKGSARSVPLWDLGANIMSALQSGLLTAGGGHAMAAGFSIEKQKINFLRDFLCNRFSERVELTGKLPELKLDGVLSVEGVKEDIIRALGVLEPFGSNNPEPIFGLPSVRVTYSSVVGDKHIRCNLKSSDGATLKGIAFRALDTEIGEVLLNHNNASLNVAGKIRENNWQGRNSSQIIIEDIALAN